MKSRKEDMKRRGFVDDSDVKDCIKISYEDSLSLLKSPEAHQRTIAVKWLMNNSDFSQMEVSEMLLTGLIKEKSLYTKIEICKVLGKCGIKTAKKMIMQLGKIGNNQYRILPCGVSRKTSYPLPRDIIARTLGKMSTEILPAMLDALAQSDRYATREIIDAIGYMCFYNDIENKKTIIEKLLMCFDTYRSDEIIRWKIVTAFSSINDESVIGWLESISTTDGEALIRNEAKRSLAILRRIK